MADRIPQREMGPSRPRIAVAFNRVDDNADAASRDVLDQVAFVEEGLSLLARPWRRLPVDPFGPWRRRVLARTDLVVNLVESPPGAPWVQVRFAEFLEAAGVPFTGSPSRAIALTTDKVATRDRLAAVGVPVAPGGAMRDGDLVLLEGIPSPWLVKPACEDASVGLEQGPVCFTPAQVAARAGDLARRFPGQAVLVEQFLPGREFNVSLLEQGVGVRVLPVAEIEYRNFPPHEPRVLGWEAKWKPDSFAYRHTVRVFPEARENRLLEELELLARAAWEACGCCGYARVDLRLDPDGRPRVLEVNTNPCLAPDAGFAAAAARAGLKAEDIVNGLLTCSHRALAA